MKFEALYPDAKPGDQFDFVYSRVAKCPAIGECRWCGAMTRWSDIQFQVGVCSEECGGAMWQQYRMDTEKTTGPDNFNAWRERVKEELVWADEAEEASVDILIVVRDQLPFFRQCIESIEENTTDYHLYIWDNGSRQPTKDYLNELFARNKAVTIVHSSNNTGFIRPNNELAAKGTGEYIILLNSDCKVFQNWKRAMVGFLQTHPDVAEVGVWGGHMGPDGRGFGGDHGYDRENLPHASHIQHIPPALLILHAFAVCHDSP